MGKEVQEAMAGVGGDAEKRGHKGKARGTGTQPRVDGQVPNQRSTVSTFGTASASKQQRQPRRWVVSLI